MAFAEWLKALFSQGSGTPARDLDAVIAVFVNEKVKWSDHRYHAEDLTIELLRLVLAESRDCPHRGERLSKWSQRSGFAALDARDRCSLAIRARLKELKDVREAGIRADRLSTASSILERHESRIERFLDLAYRKVAAPDEYGDERPEAYRDELYRFLRKLAEHEPQLKSEGRGLEGKSANLHEAIAPIATAIARLLDEKFKAYYSDRKSRSFDRSDVARMSGAEFEVYLADLLRRAGVVDVGTTPKTGDQGGDLIFVWRDRRCVVQAKRYETAVGNKAVQEAHAAKGYYACDVAWVVTNSRFTTAARSLAKELNVVLVEGEQLTDLRSLLDSV